MLAKQRRMTVVAVDLQLLGKLMRLPFDVCIGRVFEDATRFNTIQLVLEGDGLPEQFAINDSCMIQRCSPLVRREGTEVVWDWCPEPGR